MKKLTAFYKLKLIIRGYKVDDWNFGHDGQGFKNESKTSLN